MPGPGPQNPPGKVFQSVPKTNHLAEYVVCELVICDKMDLVLNSQPDSRGIIAVQINNDNSKYGTQGNNASIIFPKKFGMNPMRVKDEIRRREEPKENTIQVI